MTTLFSHGQCTYLLRQISYGLCHIQWAQRLKTVALHLKLCILDRVLVKSSLVKRSPCKLQGILVSALLRRSSREIFLGGVPVTLKGVLVSLEGVLVS